MRITINSNDGITANELLDGITATLIRDRGSLTMDGGGILGFDNDTEVGIYTVSA